MAKTLKNDDSLEYLQKVGTVAGLAKAFVHHPENWEMYQDLKNSDSAAVPPEFLLLCESVEDVFGPPSTDGAGQDDGSGHCKLCGLELEDPKEFTHECPPGFLG